MAGFPQGFLWGAATAGHQVEGGNVNADLWPMEWAEHSTFNEPSGDTCDHYHRYPEDMSLLAELGLNAYRFSLEWSRIEPEPGYYSRAALDHYGRMMESCLNLGVTPVVTYNHFTVPRWMAGRGGWSAADAPARFADYASRVTGHLGDLLSWVCTLNEPNLMAMMRSTGVLAMGAGDRGPAPEPVEAQAGVGGFDPARYRMGIVAADVEQMATAHRLAVQAIKASTGTVKAGWTLALVDLQPAEGGEDRWLEARRLGQTDWLSVSADDDFVGVQTYSRARIGPEGQLPVPEGAPTMQTGWEVYPEALGHTVRSGGRACGSARPRDRERHGNRRRRGEDRLHPRRPRGSGAVHRRRHRRSRLHPLDAPRQLRMERRLLQDVRPHRRRSWDVRAYGQAVGPLAGPGGPAQRPRLNRSASTGRGRLVDLETDPLDVGRQSLQIEAVHARRRSHRGSCGPLPR